ncbi:MAG: type II secretion system protein GspN [Polyangiaceae bacterium]|nr:type II secretion system protein GspN [Polyangiaceae bacterium]
MTPRIRRALSLAGYPAFYSVALLVFADLTFPNDKLARFIESEFNSRQLLGSGVRLEVEKASPYWLSGVELQGVRLERPQAADTEAESSAAASWQTKPGANGSAAQKPAPGAAARSAAVIEDAHVRLAILRALFGTKRVSFGASAFGGELAGVYSTNDESTELELEIERVGVSDMPLLAEAVGLPMTGALTGNALLNMPENKASKADGSITFKIFDLTVGDGKAKILNTIALPKVTVGEVNFDAEVREGILTIKTFGAKGKDLELEAEGRIRLREPFETSLMEMTMRFRFSDAYKNKSDTTRGLFGDPNSSTPGLLDLDPKVRRSKRADGFYAWSARGSIVKPTLVPLSEGASSRSTGKRPSRSSREP